MARTKRVLEVVICIVLAVAMLVVGTIGANTENYVLVAIALVCGGIAVAIEKINFDMCD